MRSTRRLLNAALAASALLAALTTSAAAREIATSAQNARAVFRPLILFSGETRVSCTVTLEATFHYRTIRKIESLIGYVTRAIIDEPNCRSEGPLGRNLRARVLTETLPWHIRYISFAGRLPAVTLRLRLIRAGFDIINVPLVGTCKVNATIEGVVGGPGGREITEGTRNATLAAESGARIRSETFGCPEGAFTSGAEPLTVLGTATPITVTLI